MILEVESSWLVLQRMLESSIHLLLLACYYCFAFTSNLGCPWIDLAEALEVHVSTVGNLATGLPIAQARKAINCECKTSTASCREGMLHLILLSLLDG